MRMVDCGVHQKPGGKAAASLAGGVDKDRHTPGGCGWAWGSCKWLPLQERDNKSEEEGWPQTGSSKANSHICSTSVKKQQGFLSPEHSVSLFLRQQLPPRCLMESVEMMI